MVCAIWHTRKVAGRNYDPAGQFKPGFPLKGPGLLSCGGSKTMGVEVGQQAPNFSLPNTERQPVTLESLRGKPVILAFFPFAFSPVCTEEMCTFRDSLADLNDANAQVV